MMRLIKSIISASIVIKYFEPIRINYNKLEDKARERSWSTKSLCNRQRWLLLKKEMIYGLLLLPVFLFFFISLVHKITLVYSDALFLKSNVALGINFIISYAISIAIINFLFNAYIKTTNIASSTVKKTKSTGKKMVKKLRSSAATGTRAIIRIPGKFGNIVIRKTIKGAKYVGSGLSKIGHKLGNGPRKIKELFQNRVRRKHKE